METQNPKELMKDFSEKVAHYRWQQKLTLEQLADKAGVSSVLLAQIEKNDLTNCSLKKLINVSGACSLRLTLASETVSG